MSLFKFLCRNFFVYWFFLRYFLHMFVSKFVYLIFSFWFSDLCLICLNWFISISLSKFLYLSLPEFHLLFLYQNSFIKTDFSHFIFLSLSIWLYLNCFIKISLYQFLDLNFLKNAWSKMLDQFLSRYLSIYFLI